MSKIIKGTVVEDSGASVLAYVLAADGTRLVQADVSSITYSVYSVSAAGVATVVSGHDAVSLTPSAIISDTLVTSTTDTRWPFTGTGYNWLHSLAYTAFPSAGVSYRYEAKVIETGGARYWVRGQWDCDGVFTS